MATIKNQIIEAAASMPWQVKYGLIRQSDVYLFDCEVPDTWYTHNEMIASVPSLSLNSGQTLTVAQIFNTLLNRTGPTVGFTDTLPTAAQMVAACPGIGINRGIQFMYRNGSTVTATIASPGGSVTLAAGNTNTVATLNTRLFMFVFTNVTPGSEAVTVYSLGASAH